jgi:GGDEF domain-containing protein
MEQEDKSILAALRQEPEQTAFLIKFSLIAASVIVAWDLLASMALPWLMVKIVTVLLMFGYGATITFVVSRIMVASKSWEFSPMSSSTRVSAETAMRRLGRERHEAPASEGDEDAESETPAHVAARPGSDVMMVPVPPVFNEQYFLMRLREQVKDARRDGRQMCVASIEVNVPGREMTGEETDRIAFEMARIGAQQWKVIGQPLAMSENEYVFSLPTSTADDAKLFVREVVQALGDYWCHFGVSVFPKNATDAEGLVEKAREACEVSRQGGKAGKVSYPLSA